MMFSDDIDGGGQVTTPTLLPRAKMRRRRLAHRLYSLAPHGISTTRTTTASDLYAAFANIHGIMAYHSCEHCHKIVIQEPQSGGQGFRCRLPYSAREAWKASRDGCLVYKMLLKGYLFATAPDELNMLARAVLGKPDVRLPRNGVHGEQQRIIYLAESLGKRPFQVRFDNKGSAVFGCLTWGSHWYPVNALPGTYHLCPRADEKHPLS